MLLCCTYCCSSAEALHIAFKSMCNPSVCMNRSYSPAYRKAVTVQLLCDSLGQNVQEYLSTLKEFCVFHLKLLYHLQTQRSRECPRSALCLCLLSSGSNKQLICM